MATFDARQALLETLLLEAIDVRGYGDLRLRRGGALRHREPVACEILGYTREELLSHDVADFTAGGIDRKALMSDRRREGVRTVTRKDGSTVPVAFLVTPTRVANLPYFVAVWWSSTPTTLARRAPPDAAADSGFLGAERRRSRTYPAWGCQTSPVLKTGWATGPVPLRF